MKMNLFKSLNKSLKEVEVPKTIPYDREKFLNYVSISWKKRSLWWKISYTWYRFCDRLDDIKRIPYNLIKTIQYLPILYKTHHDWDYGYLLSFLIFKLERMEVFYRSDDSNIMDQYIVAEEISEVVKCLKAFDSFDRHSKILNKYGYDSEGYTKVREFEQQTFERAFELMGKQMRGWWD